MPADTTAVGQLAAALMESIDESYGELEVNLGTIMIIAEVDVPPNKDNAEALGEDEDDDAGGQYGWTLVRYQCNDARQWIQLGLLEAAKRSVIEGGPVHEPSAED